MTNPNGDEQGQYIGNFHKSLPHDEFGLVVPTKYEEFRDTCLEIDQRQNKDFEKIAKGQRANPPGGGCPDDLDKRDLTAKFVSPLAGAASETLGPDPKSLEMLPAPGILSESSAAEMVELYWMALMRDVPLAGFENDTMTAVAVADIKKAYTAALANDNTDGAMQLGLDLPRTEDGELDIRPETLFGCGLKGEDKGPWINQFFLQDIPYGTQTIDTRQIPYVRKRDYMTHFQEWLDVQNSGTDEYGRAYGSGNFFCDDNNYYTSNDYKRHISTFRDMARFVNRDALHQAYFNAALLLDAVGAPVDSGNPYRDGGPKEREGGFATLGGPDLLTLVSEVASRALKVVWRQKWLVHRRCRPEAFGGLLHVQEIGNAKGMPKDFGIGNIVTSSEAAKMIRGQYDSLLLPMAYSAGSPNHPAYGAGHATVAGACSTILKAWFKEDAKLEEIFANAGMKEPGEARTLLQPGAYMTDASGELYDTPQPYTGSLTVGGEINKLASNVAMGRSIGGVHWRSDNTRSLRLGEQIAIDILRTRASEYAESGVTFTFESFDGEQITI